MMILKEKKNVLPIYGRRDDSGNEGHPSSPLSSSSNGHSDKLQNIQNRTLSPNDFSGCGLADIKSKSIGRLKPDGLLILNHLTLQRFYKSYLENMHILHPFFNKNTLYQMSKGKAKISLMNRLN